MNAAMTLSALKSTEMPGKTAGKSRKKKLLKRWSMMTLTMITTSGGGESSTINLKHILDLNLSF